MISGAMITAASAARPRRRSPARASRLPSNSPARTRPRRVLNVAANGAHHDIGPGVQQLRLAADGGGPHDRLWRQRGERRVRVGPLQSSAEDQHIPRVLALEGAGEHDARRQFRLQILEAVDGEIDASILQRLVDLFREQALAAHVGEPLVLDAIPRGGDHMLLEDAHGIEDGTEPAELGLERARLRKSQRRSACADAQGQRAAMGFYARFVR